MAVNSKQKLNSMVIRVPKPAKKGQKKPRTNIQK